MTPKMSSCCSELRISSVEQWQGAGLSRRVAHGRNEGPPAPSKASGAAVCRGRKAHLHSSPHEMLVQLRRLGPRTSMPAAVFYSILRVNARAYPILEWLGWRVRAGRDGHVQGCRGARPAAAELTCDGLSTAEAHAVAADAVQRVAVAQHHHSAPRSCRRQCQTRLVNHLASADDHGCR